MSRGKRGFPLTSRIDGLPGSSGIDFLVGGDGNDILAGGIGNDTLSGGTGADAFVLNETGSTNLDHIVDYNAAEGDKIDLQALLDANFNSGSDINDFVKLTQDGDKITIAVDANVGIGGHDAASCPPPGSVVEMKDRRGGMNLPRRSCFMVGFGLSAQAGEQGA
jgi:Ca2+-binding RTX toxin-like protein